jgi:predicted nucleic acid-binding protein
MKGLVIDASAILTYSLESNKLIEKKLKPIITQIENKKIKLFEPHFFYLETVNAVRFSVREKSRAKNIIKQIFAIPAGLVNLIPDQYEHIMKLAYENKTTAYDTIYHYVAISRNLTLLTCDKQYWQAAKQLKHIEYLG